MAIPKELRAALDVALASVAKNPKHDLALGYRQLIWSRLGPLSNGRESGAEPDGHTRRINLATYAIRKVLPFWRDKLPADETPERAIELIESLKSRRVASDDIWRVRNELWAHCDELANQHDELQIILGVGYGAVQALTVALADEKFNPQAIDVILTDQDVDPEDLDSSFFAAAVFAKGPIWEDKSDSQRRQAFWEWWISDAVPKAWSAGLAT